MKILITGGNSAIALKMLKAFTHQVVLADYGEVPAFSTSTYKFISLGKANEDTIAHSLLNCCLDESVDVILPLHSFEIIPIVKASVLFNEFNIDVLLPDAKDLNTFFGSKSFSNYERWSIFIRGELFFTTFESNELVVLGKEEQLNGVFHSVDNSDVANLKLITI